MEECLQAIFQEIDIRTQEQIVQKALMLHKLLYTKKKDYSFMCMELLLSVMINVYDYESYLFERPISVSENYVLPAEPDLYAAIFYTWYWMHKNPKALVKYIKDGVYEGISNNYTELKKFVDFIDLIG